MFTMANNVIAYSVYSYKKSHKRSIVMKINFSGKKEHLIYANEIFVFVLLKLYIPYMKYLN